jgi:NAD(P)-dependent dehydrogenase (short-subunit alcohol dehydrogenase family)
LTRHDATSTSSSLVPAMGEHMNELRFDGRVAVVTGAGRGIGRAHALLLASRGAQVVVADIGCEIDGSGGSGQPAEDVVREIRAAGGKAVTSYASVSDEAGAASIVATALEAFGRLDIVINNAGIFAPAPFESIATEQFRAMIDVHYFGTLFVTKAAWPHLLAAGYGRIINTTSESMLGIPLLSSYGAAKAAIFGLSRNAAVEGAEHGIKVNCLAPRAATRMGDALGETFEQPPEVLEQMKAAMPPEINAPAAAYLAHESCRLNGEVLFVTPGRVARLAVVLSQGLAKDEITAEDIAENIDMILNATDAQVIGLNQMP